MKCLPHNTLFLECYNNVISIQVFIKFKYLLFNLICLRLYFVITLYLYLCITIIYIEVILLRALNLHIKVIQYFTLYLKLIRKLWRKLKSTFKQKPKLSDLIQKL